MPLPEKLVWFRLRDQRFAAFRFQRHYGFGPYRLNFYSPLLRLAIEIKNDTTTRLELSPRGAWDVYEQRRKHFFAARGISVLRLNSRQVYNGLDGVISLLMQRLGKYVNKTRL